MEPAIPCFITFIWHLSVELYVCDCWQNKNTIWPYGLHFITALLLINLHGINLWLHPLVHPLDNTSRLSFKSSCPWPKLPAAAATLLTLLMMLLFLVMADPCWPALDFVLLHQQLQFPILVLLWLVPFSYILFMLFAPLWTVTLVSTGFMQNWFSLL